MQLAIIGYNGVINDTTEDDRQSTVEWRPVRGSLEAIARLHRAGWQVIVASNQPGLADGSMTPEALARQHETMHRRVKESGGAIDAIFYCPHSPTGECDCHMPKPGLLQDIAGRLRMSLRDMPVIGDSLAFIQAATAAGARPLLVKTGKGFGTASLPDLHPDVPIFDDLYNATDYLLARGIYQTDN